MVKNQVSKNFNLKLVVQNGKKWESYSTKNKKYHLGMTISGKLSRIKNIPL